MNRILCKQTPEQLTYLTQGLYSSIPYNYSALIDRILISSIPENVQTTLPVGKILRQASKMLLLNVFECSLLHYVLSEDSFQHTDLEYNEAIQQLIKYDQFVYGDRKYSSVLLFILLNGYYIKSFVNKPEYMQKVDKLIRKLIPSFHKIYQLWDKKKLLRKVSLQDINQIFMAHSFIGPRQEVHQNYNDIVDQILEMSKPYNNNKGALQEQEEIEEEIEVVVLKKQTRQKAKKNKGKQKDKQKEKEKDIRVAPSNRQLKQKEIEVQEAVDDKEMFGSLRRSSRLIRKIDTPSPSPQQPLIFKGSAQKQCQNDIMFVSKDLHKNDMLNSLDSGRNWGMNNSFFDTDNFLRSSYRRPLNFEPLLLSQPSQQSQKDEDGCKQKRPVLRQIDSQQQM